MCTQPGPSLTYVLWGPDGDLGSLVSTLVLADHVSVM
jgi:hypothetical protein